MRLIVVVLALAVLSCASPEQVDDCGPLTAYFFDDLLAGGHITIAERNYEVDTAPLNMQRPEEYRQLRIGQNVCVRGELSDTGTLVRYRVEVQPSAS